MKNSNPFAKWNDPMYKDDPFAPHNDPMRKDSPFEPWNSPMASDKDLSCRDKKYYRVRDYRDYNGDESS